MMLFSWMVTLALLNGPVLALVCNPCEVYIAPTSVFGVCAPRIHSSLWAHMFADCVVARDIGGPGDLERHFQNIIDLCATKDVILNVDFTTCPPGPKRDECSICQDLLWKEDNVKDCVDKLEILMYGEILIACMLAEHEGTPQDLANFLENLKIVCNTKGAPITTIECFTTTASVTIPDTTGTVTTPATTECVDDPCGFSGQPCFEAISVSMQPSVVSDCQLAAANPDPVVYINFMLNMKEICTSKDETPLTGTVCPTTTEPPTTTTTCDPCDLSSLECFTDVAPMMGVIILSDCKEALTKGESHYNRLMDNLAIVCQSKGHPEMRPCTSK